VSVKSFPEFNVWRGMRKRCSYQKANRYLYYGGRGIAVCSRWETGENGKSGFECFYADMGPRPDRWHTLDRIDNEGNYAPDNCRWSTWSQQNSNRRMTAKLRAAQVARSRRNIRCPVSGRFQKAHKQEM